MPIYDYKCSSCSFKAEVMRKISAANIEACPECAAETFSKQLSAPSFQLNGSGWYATDFKNGSKNMPSKDAPSPDSEVKDSASKSETAVEKKAEAAPAACATGCGCH